MNNIQTLNFQDFISSDGDHLITDSHKVASVFGKSHYVVTRRIKALISEIGGYDDFFAVIQINVDLGLGRSRQDSAYSITRDGFALLAMGFTGKKALQFKLAYIKAFSAMASFIRNQHEGLRYRCMELELADKDSVRRGSIHGKGLNLRKQEKLEIDPELKKLRNLAQPSLLN